MDAKSRGQQSGWTWQGEGEDFVKSAPGRDLMCRLAVLILLRCREFPGGPVVKTVLPVQGAQVQALVQGTKIPTGCMV